MKKLSAILMIIAFTATAILAADKSAKDYIADLTPDKDEKTITTAAEWLGNKGNKDAVPALTSLMSDSRVKVRVESAVALGLISQEASADVLNKALIEDSSAEVRYAALLATMRIGSKKSIDTYKQSLERESDPYILDLLKKLEAKAKGKK